MTTSPARGLRLSYLAFFLSGVAGLGYEVVWTRLFAVGLGHEYPSLLAVVAAFFGGLALGAWVGDGPISRSARPGRIYAWLEIAIGLWALASLALIPAVQPLAAQWIGLNPSPFQHWLISFAVPWLALLPATAAMGATLPAVERLVAQMRGDGQQVAGLYGLNTLGAAAGILLSHLVFVPNLGVQATLLVLGAVNFVCAALILIAAPSGQVGGEEIENPMADVPSRGRLQAIALATGVLGIGYEVLGIRVMAQVLENTVFSFAVALIAYLLGTSVGAWLYQTTSRKTSFAPPLERLSLGLAVACTLGIGVLSQARVLYPALHATLGGGATAAIWAEWFLAFAVFGLPSALMGALFSHLMQAARRQTGGVGAVLGINTLGSSLAPLLFGVVLLPLIGSKWALCAVAVGYAALSPRGALARTAGMAAVVGTLATAFPALWMIDSAGGRLLVAKEGRMAAVAVIDFGDHGRVLKVNDGFRMGGTGPGEFGAKRLGHLPLLLHPDPDNALFLGVGTGITFSAAGEHAALNGVGVELIPEVAAVVGQFRSGNQALLDSERLTVQVADARRYVQASAETYDVIVADLFHPARDGSGSLYTREHFEAVRSKLSETGLFCQWLPLFQVDREVLRIILRTYLEVFPDTRAYLGWFNVNTPTLGLVSGPGAAAARAGYFEQRTDSQRLRGALERIGLRDAYQFFGTGIATSAALHEFAGDGPINTDDHPVVSYVAPAQAYASGDVHGNHVEELLEMSAKSMDDWLADEQRTSSFGTKLLAYLKARDLYLEACLHKLQGDDLACARTLLESTQLSAEFRTSYEVLLGELRNLAVKDREETERLLGQLEIARPERREAVLLRRQLFGSMR